MNTHGIIGLWLRARALVALACSVTIFVVALQTSLPLVWRQALTLATPAPGALCSAWFCWRAARSPKRRSSGWTWLCGGSMMFALAQILFAAQTVVDGAPPGCGSWGDFFNALGYVGVIGGLVMIARRRQTPAPVEYAVDVALIAVASITFCWILFMAPFIRSGAQNAWVLFVEVAFPLADVALAMTCALVLQSAGRRMSMPAVVLLAMGGVAIVAGDAFYAYYQTQRGVAPGLWAELPWVWCFFLVAIAARLPAADEPSGGAPRLAEPVWNSVSALTALMASVLIVADDARADGQVAVGRLGIVGVLIALMALRQLLVLRRNAQLLRENQAYSGKMASFNEELERTVQERTRQLSALQAVTAATKSSLNEEYVLRVCAEGSMRALESDGCGVWLDGSPTPALALGDEDCTAEVYRRMMYRVHSSEPDPLGAASGLHVIYAHPTELEGVFLATWRRGQPFSEEDDALIDSIGLELATAVFNARTHARAAAEAQCDAVTGLLNHRAILARLPAELKRAQRTEQSMAVMMMDLDDFKIFNDTFGHPVGDAVLRYIAKVLRENTRSFDLVARYGGDEFVAVLPGADRDTAQCIGERIRTVLYDQGFQGPDEEIPLRISYGIAVFPDDGIASADVMNVADAELYEAKRRRGGMQVDREALRASLNDVPGFSTLDAMVAAVDHRDRYTRRHSEEVTALAVAIATELGWSERELRSIRMAGLLHNVGKIGVPEAILRKPGRLTEEETACMQRHTDIGHSLVRGLDADELVWSAARYHHERWDGRGYPRGLAGEMIPMAARIIAVADGFCAMTTHRPYRRAISAEEAVDVLMKGAGSQWDSAIVTAFLRVWGHVQRVAASTPSGE
ncbi:MAG TPA: diguanylate cyclase [Armatimonadota bacterium]